MEYEVAIVGGGITGTAALYVLSKYTSVKSFVLLEKYDDIATGVSNNKNNSQTLHMGDIETNYTLAKATKIKAGVDLMANYVDAHPKEKLARKAQKMALGVGEDEVAEIEKRHEEFKNLFPRSKLLGRSELKKVEPLVVKGRDPKVPIKAMFSENGYIMDYGAVSKSFVKNAKKTRKKIDILLSTKVQDIKKAGKKHMIYADGKEIKAKAVIVATGTYSLGFAYKLGYGKNLIIMPVAGRFLLADVKMNGKVYMMQDPKLPFAAAHADPDVLKPNETRIGPIAKVVPMLESRKYNTIWDFLKMFEFRWDSLATMFKTIADPTYLKYMASQIKYIIPGLGKRAYLKEVRKIIPSLEVKDLKVANEYGGVRPQVMNVETKKVELGAAKVVGKNILFDITPSPGASIALKNAHESTLQVMKFLGQGYSFDEKRFNKDLRKKRKD